MPDRLPNELFASWFLRSGWSKGEVARLVNRRARDLGAAHVATDTSRVRRWLDGEQPRDPIPRILTELFSERFGCVVTLSDLGLREPPSPIAGTLTDLPWSPERTAELLADFCRSDLILGRRGAGGAPPLAAGAALVEPVKRWLLPATATRSAHPLGASGAAPRPRAGRAAPLVEQLEEAARTFRAWDAAAGGGIRRAAVVGQLYEVAEVLRQAPESAAPRLFHIAAQLALLAGEMALDSGLQATAQRYQILALHCAKESADRSLAVAILAVMSRQLVELNRAQDALDLLAVGRTAGRGELEPLVCSLVDAVEARAHGALGRAERCRQAVGRALSAHRDAQAHDGTPAPPWLAGYTAATLHTELGQAQRDLADRVPAAAADAVARFETAVLMYEREGAAALRGRVSALIGVADCRTLLGDAPAVVEALRVACSLAVRLRSRRCEERLRAVLSRALERFPEETALVDLAERPRNATAGCARVPMPALPLQAFTRS
ncbi:hypothetical protein KGA66_07145 [Actinocrinis puniceicyclus]|uniref:Transcriptional regulator n=1 Tax=Actinocrinis puniceicyclus TaxID=977794 RepID=A0A8J8BC69_9ACTN|nr:hypothetical protein [Actinocrinis puniceicyclus]MBS2962811.1 hypothetical protein [Actinocrinis puniceicyclus]